MKKYFKSSILILMSLLLVLSACQKRPKMAYDTKDGGAVQDIEAFNMKSSAENFRETSEKFAKEAVEIKERNNAPPLKRRVSLNPDSSTSKPSLKIVDHNLFVKRLDRREVSLKLNNMNIQSALKLFAGLVQRNIIIGEEVSGDITVDFENIKWGSAVYALLDINNLIMTEDKDSGLLRVHTKDVYIQLEKEKIERTLEVNKNTLTLENGGGSLTDADGSTTEISVTEVFKVFFQESGDVIEPIESALGEGTSVQLINDENNNQLLVKGTPEELNMVEKILDQVDIEKKQVLIEAYIVNASDGFSENFNNQLRVFHANQLQDGQDGVSYAGMVGSPGTGGSFEFNINGDNGVTETDGTLSSAFQNETVSSGAVLIGGIGITRLKAIIQMSINDTNTETISNPKLFAMDGETATLTQGTTLLKVIPASGDAAGSTVEIPQNLTISVTPSIIGDSGVKLNMTLNNDAPGDTAGEDVATNEESITSIIQLATGEVAVLGGVYKNTKNDNTNYVPFFSKIPLLGTFFKTDTKKDDKTQLLIFVSANIV